MESNKEFILSKLFEYKLISLDFNKGHQWASGIRSPIYTDLRGIYGVPELRNNVRDIFVKKIKLISPDYVAGVATGAIGYAAIVSDHLEKPMLYIRSKQKNHGLGQSIEGSKNFSGKSVVIIEDTVSTGGSLSKAKNTAEKSGLKVLKELCIFKYATNTESILSLSDIVSSRFVTSEERRKLIEFSKMNGLLCDS